MGNIYKVIEIVDMGIEKEKKRRDFYAQAAEKFQKPELKDLFTRLAVKELIEEEKKHLVYLHQLREKLEG